MRATSIPNLGRESVSATGEFLTEKMLPGKGQNIGEKGLRLSTGATHGASSPRWADFEWSASADDTSGCGISTKRKALRTAVAVRLLAALAVGQAQEQYLECTSARCPPYSTLCEKRVTRNSSRQMPRWLQVTETVIDCQSEAMLPRKWQRSHRTTGTRRLCRCECQGQTDDQRQAQRAGHQQDG